MGPRRGVLVGEAPGVGDQPDVERLGDRRRQIDVEPAHQIPDDLGRAGGLPDDVVDRSEARVVVVVIDVHERLGVAQRGQRVAVEVAAVEEDRRAALEVLRRLGGQSVEREEAVLGRQRELLGRDHHHRVLAQRAQQRLHRHQRAERVAVEVLVRHDGKALAAANLAQHLLTRVERHRCRLPHARSRSNDSTRSARSVVES